MSTTENTSAVNDAVAEDLASPSSSAADDERAHSFRERRLTYTRHHILSDSAAAAVAELLADGDDFSDDDSAAAGGGAAKQPNEPSTSTADGVTSTKPPKDTNQQQQQQRPHKRAKTEESTASSSSPSKSSEYLPSRILHAGEIVRRFSLNSTTSHDSRTGSFSHPTHPHAAHHHHHGGSSGSGSGGLPHKNKWRQRFSFCSTTPNHLLPFPRHIVGTYSCHGMEPVYDSDYSHDDDDDDESEDEHPPADSSGLLGGIGRNNNKSTTAKINQDRGGIAYPYANSTKQALFAVYDGHGEGGELVSQYALGEVQRLLQERLQKLPNGDKNRMGCISEEEEEGGEENSEQQQETSVEDAEKEERIISEAMREVFVKVDRGLLDEAEIEPMYSGTTACVVLLRNNKLYISNCGDSRAVLARKKRKSDGNSSDNSEGASNATNTHNLTTINLSTDQNPDSPGEKERILASGGFVSPPPEPGLSSRVWLDASHTQIGLAMARSIGDHAVKGVGVIAEPVVTTHDIQHGKTSSDGIEDEEGSDEFMIMATDGVWEFISSEDAVDIVSEHLYKNDGTGGASIACEALIKAASEKWHEHEGDYRDDITAIVIRLKDLWN